MGYTLVGSCLPANIRLELMCTAVANAYYDAATVTAVKSFIAHVPGKMPV
jgi:hypothetical protein